MSKIYDSPEGYCVRDENDDFICLTDTKGVAENIIIALEKQTATKPIISQYNGICGVPYKSCPSCEKLLWGSKLDKEDKFCSNCGQRINWGM